MQQKTGRAVIRFRSATVHHGSYVAVIVVKLLRAEIPVIVAEISQMRFRLLFRRKREPHVAQAVFRWLWEVAKDLKDRGKVDIAECFIDGTFCKCQKGARY